MNQLSNYLNSSQLSFPQSDINLSLMLIHNSNYDNLWNFQKLFHELLNYHYIHGKFCVRMNTLCHISYNLALWFYHLCFV